MHKIAGEIIQQRNEEVISMWNYEKRKNDNPNGCICYQQDKKCHDVEELNCFFCYCPNYDRTVKEGKCKIDSPQAKYVDNCEGKILDCSDCTFPHSKENATKLLENLFK